MSNCKIHEGKSRWSNEPVGLKQSSSESNSIKFKDRKEKDRAGLIFLCSKLQGEKFVKEFLDEGKSHREAVALVSLPLERDVSKFLINSICTIASTPVYQEMIAKIINKDDSYGIGFNPSTKNFLIRNWKNITSHVGFEENCILSTIENPSLRHGYPNIDIVGCLGFGSIEVGEKSMDAAIREATEESKLMRIVLEGATVIECEKTLSRPTLFVKIGGSGRNRDVPFISML